MLKTMIVVKQIGFSKQIVSKQIGFPEVFEGPGRFKKLREACRIHFHLVAPLKTVMVTSYDRKNKKLTTKKATTISM